MQLFVLIMAVKLDNQFVYQENVVEKISKKPLMLCLMSIVYSSLSMD